MGIYQDSGFLDFPHIMGYGMPFTFMDGARGIGKTYGALDWAITRGVQFIYMRRTQKELDSCASEKLNPFKRLNKDKGWNYQFFREKDLYIIGPADGTETAGTKIAGPPIGIGVALSTFANIRGFDGSDFDMIVYDEFIPERRARPIRDEFDALMNAYETVNRNREFTDNKPPLQLLAMSNSNRLDNPIYIGLGIVSKIHQMSRRGQEVSIMREKGLAIIHCLHSPISELKRETALYKLTAGSSFASMALDNYFLGEEGASESRARPLKEYRPVAAIGEICIYEHKSNGRLYVSEHRSGSPDCYGTGETERERFKSRYFWIMGEHLRRNIEFESRLCEILFIRFLG